MYCVSVLNKPMVSFVCSIGLSGNWAGGCVVARCAKVAGGPTALR